MKNILDQLLIKLNKYPIASIFFVLTILTYFYTNRVLKHMEVENEIHIVEKSNYWFLTVLDCQYDQGIHGSELVGCDEIEISDPYDSYDDADRALQKIIRQQKDTLYQIDFLNFRSLGTFFINIPYLLFAALGIYDIKRKGGFQY
jgi:hypothetical protein